MIFTETAKREITEMQLRNQERIGRLGVHPLCQRCLRECKVANAENLTLFFCVDFEGK